MQQSRHIEATALDHDSAQCEVCGAESTRIRLSRDGWMACPACRAEELELVVLDHGDAP